MMYSYQIEEDENMEMERIREKLKGSASAMEEHAMSEQLDYYKQQCQILMQQTLESRQQIEMLQTTNRRLMGDIAMSIGYSEQSVRHDLDSVDEKSMESTATKRTNDTQQTLAQKCERNQFNLHRLQDQIHILQSDKFRNKSLLICCKPEWVTVSGKPARNYSFRFFVEHDIDSKLVDKLFGKFNADTVNGRQLARVLTLLVIIYRVKLHKLRTGKREKPDMNTTRIQEEVLHLSVWIIRTFGSRIQDRAQSVTVWNDEGEMVEGQYYVYGLDVRKNTFREDLKRWTTKYVNEDTNLVMES